MPSDLEDLRGFSSSLSFSHSGSLPSERQLGFLKSETTINGEVKGDLVASSRLGKPLPAESQMVKPLECGDYYPNQDHKVNHSLLHTDEAEASDGHSFTLLRPVDQDPISSTSYFAEDKQNSLLAANYENSLFSSSLSEIFCSKMRLSASNALYNRSANVVASKSDQEEPLESLEEIEAQTIGDLLPNDDDLLSGMTEGVACIARPRNVNDLEELDIFSSIGGMDLGDDSSSSRNLPTIPVEVANNRLGLYNNSITGTHPHGKHPSRRLLVRNIDGNVEDFELRALFEQYGDLRTLYTACKQQGFVLISYYDIRSAQNAIKALQNRPLRHRKLDLHYSIPKDNPVEVDINQGTLVVFNLDSSISNDKLHQIFGVYGEIKEIWESPHGGDHKMIEFYDVRAAEAALQALNGGHIAGKRIKLEPSRSEGRRPMVQQLTSELDQDKLGLFLQQNSSPCNSTAGFSVPFPAFTGKSSGMGNGVIMGNGALSNPLMGGGFSNPNGLQSLLRVDPIGNQSGLAQPVQSQSQKIDIRGISAFHPHSLPEYHNGLTNYGSPGSMTANYHHVLERMSNRQLHGVSSNEQSAELNKTGSASGGHPIPGHHVPWSNSYQPQATGIMLPNSPSPSFVNGYGSPRLPPQLHGIPRAPSQMLNRVLPLNNHHVGSEPTSNSMWDRCHTYMGESTEASKFHPGSLGSIGVSNNSVHSMEFVPRNIFPHLGGNCMDLSTHRSAGVQSPQQRSMIFPGRGHMTPMVHLFDSSSERARSRRTESGFSHADKKLFELDIDRIIQGEDNRTTLMLKNIPNKYTSKMLLAAIDERHKGTYDFIYLPIDFKNKCNVGYAFINMTDPKNIIPFYQTFHGRKWEKFNSEKVASLAYGRIQGKAALVAHFQNSSLMNEDKRCRPILFNTEGPNAGDQVPFPMGVNIRTRPGRSKTNIHEETPQGSPPNAANEEILTNGNISGSAKESV